jgi:hypothetical protein
MTFGAPTLGEVLAERYQLQEHIGDDNFGRQIFRGIDVVLRRPVAVVLRYPGGAAATEMLDAAVAASRVTHPHLVDVYDAIDEGTRAYVVREWVDGGSLREYVAETPMEPDRATSVAHAVASAVAAVHANGVTHGNIHPGTVLIGSDGRVVLSDARSDESITPDSDVRAVGAVLYCALTGHWPQAEAGVTSLPDAVRDPAGVLASPRQVRGGVPGHLSDLATDLLDAEIPPPSADVLAADLGRLDAEGDDEFFVSGGPLDFNQDQYREAPPTEAPRPIGRKLAIGVAGLLVLAVVGLLLATNFLIKDGNTASPNNTVLPTGAAATSRPSGTSNGGAPQVINLNANQVRIVDPPQGTRSELDNADNMVDGNSGTAWTTEHYNEPNFGAHKPGMGVLINLGSKKSVSTVKVNFTVQGATVQLRYGTSDPGSSSNGDKQIANTYKPIGDPVQAKTNVVLSVPAEIDPVQYVMVWITELPPADDGRYQVGISEIQVSVNS